MITPELEEQLRLLIERTAITDLLNRFARAADKKDWRMWEECYTDDATVEFPFARHGQRRHSPRLRPPST